MESEAHQEESGVSRELPRVQLGERSSSGEAPMQRVIPGRINLTWFGWIMSALLLSSAALAAWFSWSGEEWSFWMVILAWSLMWLWNWLYMEAWTYQRRMLKYLSALSFMSMTCAMAWLCHDRAATQDAWRGGALVLREWSVALELTMVLLSGATIVMLAHLVWFGRGWRVKQRRPDAVETQEMEAT